jgi:hypothetical protein
MSTKCEQCGHHDRPVHFVLTKVGMRWLCDVCLRPVKGPDNL